MNKTDGGKDKREKRYAEKKEKVHETILVDMTGLGHTKEKKVRQIEEWRKEKTGMQKKGNKSTYNNTSRHGSFQIKREYERETKED